MVRNLLLAPPVTGYDTAWNILEGVVTCPRFEDNMASPKLVCAALKPKATMPESQNLPLIRCALGPSQQTLNPKKAIGTKR